MPPALFPLRKTVLGLALGLSLGMVACGRPPQQGGAPPAVPVTLETLEPGTFEDTSEFVGSLEAEQRVELRPETNGRITQIFVQPGDAVSPGQPVMQLRPDQAQAQVEGAQAGADAARYGRDAAQAQLEAAQAQLLQTESDVQLAEVEFRRTKSLVEDGALSAQDLDRSQNQLEVARAAQRRAEDNVRAAQSQLQQAASTLNQAQADVQVNQENLGFTQVTAPIAGFMGDILFKVGDYVSTGQTVTTITENRELYLRIQVPTTRSAQLRPGLPVELVDPNTGEPLATGSLNFVSPEVNTNAQSILVRARFPNEAGVLREGQFVRARIIWNTTSALLVPTIAISRVGGQSFVFVAEEQVTDEGQTLQVVSQRPVQLGAIQGNTYRVLDGLEAGEQIAVTNILKLQDGVPIQPETEEASAATDSGTTGQ
jgi:RND family efflux transporter MFP subunit